MERKHLFETTSKYLLNVSSCSFVRRIVAYPNNYVHSNIYIKFALYSSGYSLNLRFSIAKYTSNLSLYQLVMMHINYLKFLDIFIQI